MSESNTTIEGLVNAVTTPEPHKREKGYEKYQHEKMEMQDILDRCMEIRMLLVCEDDEILLRVGRYWYSGRVTKVGKLGVVLANQGHEVAIALGKISVIEIINRGKWYYEYKKTKP